LAEYDVGSIVARMRAEASGWSAAVEKMVKDVDKLEARFKALGGIGAAMAAGAGLFIGAGIKQNATIERLSVSYRVLLKDAEAANQAMSYVRKLADTSPYQMEEMLDAGRAMLAYGLDLKTYMTDAMNLAAAMGVQLNDVVRALGRIKSGDFGEAFERLRDFGLSRDLLEGKGLVFDRSGAYKGSVEQALSAIQAIIRERFGGMVEEQSQTWNGLISTIADKLKSITADANADLFAALKGPLEGLKNWLEGLDETAAKAVGSIIQFIGVLGLLVATGFAIVVWGEKVRKTLAGIGLATKTLFTNPVFLAIAAATGLVIALGKMKAEYDKAKKAAEQRAKAAETEKKSLRELLDTYKETERQLRTTKAGTTEYKRLEAELHRQMQEIGRIYPQVVTAYDEMNRVRGISVELLEREIDAQAKLGYGTKGIELARKHKEIKDLESEINRLQGYLEQAKTGKIVDESRMIFLSKEVTPDKFAEFVAKTQQDLAAAKDKMPQLEAEMDALLQSVKPKDIGEGGNKDLDKTRAKTLQDLTVDYLTTTKRLEEADKQQVRNKYEALMEENEWTLQTVVEVAGQKMTIQEAMEAELSAIHEKYEQERLAITQQVQDEIDQINAKTTEQKIALLDAEKQRMIEDGADAVVAEEWFRLQREAVLNEQAKKEQAIAENLQRALIEARQEGLEAELALMELDKAKEVTDAMESIENAELRAQVLADIEEKYRLLREAAIKRHNDEITTYMADLQRDILQLQEEGLQKELELLKFDRAQEEARARETIKDETALQEALAKIAEKYRLKENEIRVRYARETAETQANIELAELEYQHQYKLISDEEYYSRRIELAKANAERMMQEHGAESEEYKKALSEITLAEYESIIAREGLEKELTRVTLEEVQARLQAQLLSGTLSKEQADATVAALALIHGKLEDITKEETEQAEQNLKTLQSTIQSGLATILKDFAHGEKSIVEIWEDMLNRMLDSFIDFISKLAAEKLATWVLSVIPGLSLKGGGIVPSGLAVASAAGGMLTGSFSGGIPAILHEKEMVLPRNISEFILDTMAQTGGGAQGPQAIIQISAVDGPSVQRMLYEQRDTIAGILAQAWKRNSPIRRGG